MDQSPQLDELVREWKKADHEDRERVELFQTFANNQAWKLYVELLNRLIQARGEEILRPAGSVDGAIGLEYVKGAMSGLIMARDLPQIMIMAMKAAGPATDGEE